MVVILLVGPGPEGGPPQSPTTTVNIVSPSYPQVPDYETKEEEWIKKKKTEVVTKRQIATRVQRNVLLKDGKVIEDSGPKVTTTTTEDTTKEETENTEHHDVPDGGALEWRPTGDPNLLSEVREKKVTTRQETNETIETEDIKHLGNISDQAYQKAVESGGEVDRLLARAPGTEVSTRGPVVVSHHSSSRKTTDTEDTVKTSALDGSGNVVTNTSTVRDHEVVKELDAPDVEGSFEDFEVEKRNEYSKSRTQEFVDSVKENGEVRREMRYDAETTEGKRHGDADWESLSARLRRNRNRFLKEMEEERKDALTRRPLDFNQEERTRKVETSKWLEHHFGSESTSRSSKDSEDEGPQTSFINVTMKSTKDPKPSKVFLSSPDSTEKSFFKGVSEWKSEERKVRSPKIEGVQVLPTGPNHTFNSSPSPPYAKSPSPPSYRTKSKSPSPAFVGGKLPSTQNLERLGAMNGVNGGGERYTRTTNYYRHERTSSPLGRGSPQYNGSSPPKVNGKITPTRTYTPTSVSPPPRRRNRRIQREEEPAMEEPAPDYSPTPEPKSPHSPTNHDSKKKVYQRTRFAADIPPPPGMKHHHHSQQEHHHHHHTNGHSNNNSSNSSSRKKDGKSGLGESFRRLVGRLRGSSGGGGGGGGGANGRNSSSSRGSGSGGGGGVDSGTQTNNSTNGETGGMATVHRYYLGEDPFRGSIYGKESEYPRKKSELRHQSNSTSTLGRLSKSTSKLSSDKNHVPNGTTLYYNGDRGGVQTLPRKLQEHKTKKQVYVTRSNGEAGSHADRYRLGNNSNSMFNVSIVNNVANGGPAKPARTYRSNLLRSKSFNVHGLEFDKGSNRYTSNPQLHRLDEESPLKSPGIVTSISRSTRDLSQLPEEGRWNYRNGTTDTKKKVFMKGLMERAPELYRTLHENEPLRTSTPLKNGKVEYSTSFRSNSPLHSYSPYRGSPEVNRSLVRRGSNDYTETVSYTTKSDDPHKPSVTNTVQSFTKKTVPIAGGRQERIESTETKTIRKSHFRSGTPDLSFNASNKYSPNGGVIIEVRNTRK